MDDFMTIAHDGMETQTETAYLFRFGKLLVWIPKFLVVNIEDGTVEIPTWKAIDFELDQYGVE